MNVIGNGTSIMFVLGVIGTAAGMSKDKCIVIAQNIEKCVKDMLGKYI